MTLSPAYSPWHDAAERHPDIHIERCSLSIADAAWVPKYRVILIEKTLGRAARNAALAHELAHIDLGHHHVDPDDWASWKLEVAADKLAARRLIDIDRLAEAARVCSTVHEVAQFLEVTVPLLKLRVQTLHPSERAVLARCARERTEDDVA